MYSEVEEQCKNNDIQADTWEQPPKVSWENNANDLGEIEKTNNHINAIVTRRKTRNSKYQWSPYSKANTRHRNETRSPDEEENFTRRRKHRDGDKVNLEPVDTSEKAKSHFRKLFHLEVFIVEHLQNHFLQRCKESLGLEMESGILDGYYMEKLFPQVISRMSCSKEERDKFSSGEIRRWDLQIFKKVLPDFYELVRSEKSLGSELNNEMEMEVKAVKELYEMCRNQLCHNPAYLSDTTYNRSEAAFRASMLLLGMDEVRIDKAIEEATRSSVLSGITGKNRYDLLRTFFEMDAPSPVRAIYKVIYAAGKLFGDIFWALVRLLDRFTPTGADILRRILFRGEKLFPLFQDTRPKVLKFNRDKQIKHKSIT